MASLSIKHINKTYPNGFEAVKDFNLEIEDKEIIIFVGPSGCGKSDHFVWSQVWKKSVVVH